MSQHKLHHGEVWRQQEINEACKEKLSKESFGFRTALIHIEHVKQIVFRDLCSNSYSTIKLIWPAFTPCLTLV